MMNVNFNITSTTTNCFTSTQAAKVDAGIEIFKQVLNSEEFQNKVQNFQWRTSDGVAFNRFFMSNGMSNQQVWDCLNNNMNWKNGLTNVTPNTNTMTVNVVPCATHQEMVDCCNNTFPFIGMNVNMLNNTWYTPIHVACAMMHEWCVMCGFDCGTPTSKMENWTNYTVPVACAWMCKDTAAKVSNSSEVTNWSNMINNQTFDYCACSMNCNTWNTTTNCNTTVTKMDECINMMETEMNWLKSCNNITPDVSNRMTVLTNSINAMHEMKMNLCNTSMDGTDWACMPVNVVNTVNAN